MSEESQAVKASNQLRLEIDNVIDRYSDEADLTAYQVIGILEVIKADIIERCPLFPKRES